MAQSKPDPEVRARILIVGNNGAAVSVSAEGLKVTDTAGTLVAHINNTDDLEAIGRNLLREVRAHRAAMRARVMVVPARKPD